VDRGLGLCDQGDIGKGMLWLAWALESAPPDSDGLRRTIRRNLSAWQPHLTPLRAILAHVGGYLPVAFSPDGKILVSLDIKAIRTWDTSDFRPHAAPLFPSLARDTPCALAFDPAGNRMAMAGLESARVWDLSTGLPIGPVMKFSRER